MPLHHLTTAEIAEIRGAVDALNQAFPWRRIDRSSDATDAFLRSPERKHLADIIRALALPSYHELIALIWLGRKLDTVSFSQFLLDAQALFSQVDVKYLMDRRARLSIYLDNGLSRLKEAGAVGL